MSDVDQVDQVVERVTGDHGRLDAVVHAADVDAKELIAETIVTGGPVNVTSRLEVAAC